MTLDKFGRHISKRAKIDPTILADNVIENVEQTIILNFTTQEKYIKNNIVKLSEIDYSKPKKIQRA